MSQETGTHEASKPAQGDEHSHGGNLLGPILCWAVVFADIGTSVYYVPGILYGSVGNLAGFFVFLTMSVFVLLTLKYAEVTYRFPQGGGVVTVAAEAINHWVGALGGMFILVDYFLTAAISCLSGIMYFSVVVPSLGASIVVPALGPLQLPILFITIALLALLGLLNWVGISESAKVSLVGAVIAFVSDIAILITVFTHISFSEFLSLFPKMFAGHTLTPLSLLIGFAGSFLAFSGLESISQLSPVMRTPRKKVARMALLLVVVTIGLTSPLLTMFSTLLQPAAANDPLQNGQLISLLAGHFDPSNSLNWGTFLQVEVAISASALLVFASNTAIIGAYHVFMALSRMGFFPEFILRRNKLRGTPHFSIAFATGIPIVVLLLVLGNINILGDMYAFGLLGAFSLTCLGLDIIRRRDHRAIRQWRHYEDSDEAARAYNALVRATADELRGINPDGRTSRTGSSTKRPSLWKRIEFWLGILTTFLVMLAWSTNLWAKPLATAFGGTVTLLGMGVAFLNYRSQERKGRTPVFYLSNLERLPDSILAVLMPENESHNEQVIRVATSHADGKPVIFLYIGEYKPREKPLRLFEYYDPYAEDKQAKRMLGRASSIAKKAKVNCRFVYRQADPEAVAQVWQIVHPHDTIMAAQDASQFKDINPDRIRYELTPGGKVAHLLKRW